MQNTSVEHTNIVLIYEYTESVLKSVNDSIRSLNTKLSSVIGFSGVLLKFTSDLRHDTVWFITLQVSICLLLIAASWIGFWGLQPKNVGDIVSPKELRQDFYYESDEECRRYIVDNWNNAVEQLDQNRDEKQWHLNGAIVSFVLASSLFAIDIILDSFT